MDQRDKHTALSPYGKALLDHHQLQTTEEIIVRRDDGFESRLPPALFFRSEDHFLPGEIESLSHCRGKVLDIGAGTGIHARVLQSRGLDVTAMDVDPNACRIMSEYGMTQVVCSDIRRFQGGPFDTLLMLGHGIGMVEDLKGLAAFLEHAPRLLSKGGQLIFTSVDVSKTDDPVHLKYHEEIQRKGRYKGEVRIQFEYKGERGPFGGWLHIDPRTLKEVLDQQQWDCDVIYEDASGEYAACLFIKSI